MTPNEIKNHAKQIGFDDARIAGPTPKTWDRFHEWISKNYHGEMHYLADRAEQRKDPSFLQESTRSVIVVAKRYLTVSPSPPSSNALFQPVISRYAWGDDYHNVVAEGLKKLVEFITIKTDGKHQSRWCVDTAPVLEKDFAAQSGLGWIGKHTNALSRKLGNWFFIGVILTTMPLEADKPESNHCGTCTKCLDICPTKAFVAPFIMDARRCISYLTIELKGPIPREFRRAMGMRIYGCDDCLEICPWNRFAVPSNERFFPPRDFLQHNDLIQLMQLSDDEFRSAFKDSPIKRTKRRGFLRNVAIALGNTRNPKAAPVLIEALKDAEALIRGHAAWALGEIGGKPAIDALHSVLQNETDPWVREEIVLSIQNLFK